MQVLLGALALISASVWAAESPIGVLNVVGKATVIARGESFTLQNEDYAYFSDDGIRTNQSAHAVLLTTDGLKVVYAESSYGEVSQTDNAYRINVKEGRMNVHAGTGVAYQLFSKGAPISPNNATAAGGEFILSAMSNGDDAQISSPTGLTQQQIDALLASEIFSDAELNCLIERAKRMPQAVLAVMSHQELDDLADCDKSAVSTVSNGQIALLAALFAAGAVIITDDSDPGS